MKYTWLEYEQQLRAATKRTRTRRRDTTVTLPLPPALGARYLRAALKRVQEHREAAAAAPIPPTLDGYRQLVNSNPALAMRYLAEAQRRVRQKQAAAILEDQ